SIRARPLCKLSRTVVIPAGDQLAALRDLAYELPERVSIGLRRREHVDVVIVERRHDRDLGLKGEERVVVFVRLDDEHIRLARMRVRADTADRGAADERRVDTTGAQTEPGHCGRR